MKKKKKEGKVVKWNKIKFTFTVGKEKEKCVAGK